MFLSIDQKPSASVAALDDSGASVTYGDICSFVDIFKEYVPRRTLVFLMTTNCIGSLLGYTSCLSNHIVPLVLSAFTEKGLYEHLRDLYRPEYLWIPSEMQTDFGDNLIFSAHGYSLVSTGLVSPRLYEDLALLLPTSGSTGSPKLVRHSYRNIEANAENVSKFFEITPQYRAMAILPMHYTMGLSVISSHLYKGATILLCSKSMLDKGFWSMLKEGRVTILTGVPYSFEILNKMRFFRMDLPDLQIITQGGGKMSDELFMTCADYAEKTGKKFIATYGQTEGTARMAYLPAELAKAKVGSIGIAEPGGRLSIIDDAGNETFEGEATGEMIYRGENVTLGYASCAEDLMKGDENHGILHTGDIVRRDSDGCYFVIGRLKRFLKIFGLRIGLDEVEHIIKSTFDTDCLCSGTDDMLTVRITNPSIKEEVLNLIMKKTKLFHKNIEVICVEKIGRNETGKAILH